MILKPKEDTSKISVSFIFHEKNQIHFLLQVLTLCRKINVYLSIVLVSFLGLQAEEQENIKRAEKQELIKPVCIFYFPYITFISVRFANFHVDNKFQNKISMNRKIYSLTRIRLFYVCV